MTFALPDGSQLLLMVPAADMANHHPSPADARYHLYATEEREVSLYARWELEPGEEVTINYGRGVGEGTLHYGFVVR
ncbi:hypothetical protein DFJ74DRAFT_665481 [Hyaloraphidium curvatum]|nr:hypothetical protein DFJ74DRAFT_665481 [Hyaloraphidium curvatum]